MANARVAIIGLGRMGSTIDDEVVGYPSVALPYSIAATCAASERLELVAGCDLLAEKRQAFAERWGVSALYQDYRDMLRQEQPDLVAICTRGENHAELCVGVAEYRPGAIYCEKAIACSLTEADAVRAAVGDIPFSTGVLRRYDPRYQVVRDAIADGAIGTPAAVVHYAETNLLHGHSHSIDTMLYLLGDPQVARVRGELQPRTLQPEGDRLAQDPNSTYQLETVNGVRGVTIPAGAWEFEVIGSGGTIRTMNNGVSRLYRKRVKITPRFSSIDPHPLPEPEQRSATLVVMEELAAAAQEGGSTREGVGHAHHVTEACLAVAESHRQGGRWLDLPLVTRSLYVYHV
ncbi:MAG: Gfo/Idh/MocA family oxidoreductase [Armatimonadetes bacterium]|nr:Gfo/Idh/MocA family oxidoreductase [Armatimonadota bacterium]